MSQTAEPKKLSARVPTPEFRVSFPNVFAPKKNELNGNMEYSIVMLFDKKVDMSKMKALAQRVAKEKWPNGLPANFRSPFRDGDKEKTDRSEFKNVIFITARTK